MQKVTTLIVFLILFSLETIGQACGGGLIEFKILEKEFNEEVVVNVIYKTPEFIDSLCAIIAPKQKCNLNFKSGTGMIINDKLGKALYKESNYVISLNVDSNNIFGVITPELGRGLAIIKFTQNRETFFFITNGGGCVDGKNAIYIENEPKLISLSIDTDLVTITRKKLGRSEEK